MSEAAESLKNVDSEHVQLSERIVRDINIGKYGPGEWLKQIDLEQRYGVTRIAVRRVLDELVAKRLVEHIPNRGYRVYALSPTQRREVSEIRTLLETAAAPGIVERATEKDIEDLTALAEGFKEAAYNGTILEQNEANLRFHLRLLELCANKSLVELITELRQRGPAAPVTRWHTVAQLEKASNDHFLIVDAIKNRDVEAMKTVITSHINDKGPERMAGGSSVKN
ncbi:GntR family transcriptional regulator [Nitratireductor aquimarinus]|uniref:GntR family transcriptional regulator n=1 Tax=Nitratireductor aquimarinus TaxID=889300 RepID=A0ABU4AQS9_9HYPH|nr:GntR family transcriptional regulator [Nitratireductor aquimarinus]MDV6228599.1 GntR family transcriptional regulator [Nitratireductor aquimarinus]